MAVKERGLEIDLNYFNEGKEVGPDIQPEGINKIKERWKN